jgi:hypothetical protein
MGERYVNRILLGGTGCITLYGCDRWERKSGRSGVDWFSSRRRVVRVLWRFVENAVCAYGSFMTGRSVWSRPKGDTSRNGNLCTFAESRCNVLNRLAGQRQRIAPCPRTTHSLLRSADYERLRCTEFALAYVAIRFLKCPRTADRTCGGGPAGAGRPGLGGCWSDGDNAVSG